MNAETRKPYRPAKGTEPWNRGRKLPPDPLTDEEARKLIQTPSRTAPTGIRNAALLAVLWGAGLRVSEALALKVSDWGATAGLLRVQHGKGDRDRVAKLAGETAPYLERWLERRSALGFNGRQPLFCTLEGKPLSTSYVRTMIRREAEAAGIERRVHPHGLRHSHASHLAARGASLPTIQGQLGHTNPVTTARYIARLCPRQRAEEIDRVW